MTTIKINNKLRKNLKQICLDRDLNYNALVEEMFYIYNNLFSKFRNEQYFREWFEKNYNLLGYKKIIKSNPRKTPDFIMLKDNNKEEKVELEFLDTNFILHKHKPSNVDLIISLFGTRKSIKGVRVLSFLEGKPIFPGTRRINLELSDEEHLFLVNYKLQKKFVRLEDVITDMVRKFKKLKGGI